MTSSPPSLAYIHSDTPNNVRVSKCLRTFSRLFRRVAYVGCWRNRPWDGAGGTSGVEYYMLDQQLRRGTASLSHMPAFVRHVRAALDQFRPDVVVTTNEDLVPLFAIGVLPRSPLLVCDLIDSIETRIVGKARHLQPFWTGIATFSRKAVDAIVEVTEDRLNQHRSLPKHHAVILNSPVWADVVPREDIRSNWIYVCGSIVDDMSGVETLLEACESSAFDIVFAGRSIGPWVRDVFARSPRVHFLGEVSPDESLRIAAAAAAIFAHYNPNIPNHVFAAPNKLYDAMMVGVPLFINSECRISNFAQREGFGILTPYGDSLSLYEAFRQLEANNHTIRAACAAARQKFRELYAWDHMESRWRQLFAELGVTGLAS